MSGVRFAMLLAAVFVVVLFGLNIGQGRLSQFLPPPRFDMNLDRGLEAAVRGEAGARTLRALNDRFPDRFAALESLLVDAQARRATEAEAVQIVRVFNARLQEDLASAVARAPTPQLMEVIRREGAALKSLQRDSPVDCGRFGDPGWSPYNRISRRSYRLIDEAGVAAIDAAHAAMLEPVFRSPVMDLADEAAFQAAIERHGDPQVLATLALPSGMQGQCEAKVLVYEAFADLPEESAGRIIAVSLGRYR